MQRVPNEHKCVAPNSDLSFWGVFVYGSFQVLLEVFKGCTLTSALLFADRLLFINSSLISSMVFVTAVS